MHWRGHHRGLALGTSPLQQRSALRFAFDVAARGYLEHAIVETTMIYTHVVEGLRTPARSPLDILKARVGT